MWYKHLDTEHCAVFMLIFSLKMKMLITFMAEYFVGYISSFLSVIVTKLQQ